MRDATCVVLAAGLGTRMGGEKLSKSFGSGTILDAVLDACAGFPTVVVASPAVKLDVLPSNMQVLVNNEPERGMAHSLRLANAVVTADHPIAVLLGDKPLVNAGLLERMIGELGENDVTYPVRSGTPGHPVVFSPFARALIIGLRDGDTIHMVRDHEMLTRHPVEINDEGAYADIDTEEDYRKLRP
ncbi:MAG TPA: NTP transferase domain-containing protein [Candidatus Baltobacteraceae bacterium]|jgi:molybdenum cofactor cytidylyltransferase